MRRLRNRNVPISNDCADFNMINNCFEDVQPPAANTSKSCLEMFMLFVNILCLGGLVFIWYRQELIKSDLDNIVKNLDNTYSDFALELNGAKIVKVDAEPVAKKSFFGVGLCDSCENFDPQGPSKIIQPSMRPGECWAFHGSKATAVIKLSRDVLIRDVTLEHLEKNFSPSHKNDFAPKNFKIWGIEEFTNLKDSEKILLGEFIYDANDKPSQRFITQYSPKYFGYIEFEVLSNHGNPSYTCVYRLQVHGTQKP